MVTGEPMPVDKQPEARVTGGTINTGGSFLMRAEKVGADTLLSQIVRMVGEAQRSRAPIQRTADAIAAWFVPAVVLIAIVASVAWGTLGPSPRLAHALVAAVAVLIIACPCALGLATPMAIMVGTGQGARHGVLVRDARALESMEKINTLVIDKTGTLTEGKPEVTDVKTFNGFTEEQVLQSIASVESHSEHPIASSIVRMAQRRGLTLLPVTDFESMPGKGIAAQVTSKETAHRVSVGNAEQMRDVVADIGAAQHQTEALRGEAKTVLFAAFDNTLAAVIAVADPIRGSSAEALRQLRVDGIDVVMATGDNSVTALAVARQLGIKQVEAAVLPVRKAQMIQELQAAGKRVAMAGDGVNDAPALAQADVGIAMGSGTDVALESGDMALLKGDLRGIMRARRLSKGVMRNIRQNLFFAFVYNAAGIPLAAGALYPVFHMTLNPVFAAAAMSLSSVSVISNSLRLRNLKL
jgi:Cu+-exporting ATPase